MARLGIDDAARERDRGRRPARRRGAHDLVADERASRAAIARASACALEPA
jgi:hypothetical protein